MPSLWCLACCFAARALPKAGCCRRPPPLLPPSSVSLPCQVSCSPWPPPPEPSRCLDVWLAAQAQGLELGFILASSLALAVLEGKDVLGPFISLLWSL